MKKLVLALALAIIPMSVFADQIVYKTFEEAWAACINGRVAANWVYTNGSWVQNGWVCIPGSGGGNSF